jgi:uncharacterized protein
VRYCYDVENATYELHSLSELFAALTHAKNLIQILTGPRQVGKSTVAMQLMDKWEGNVRYASADLPIPPGAEWIAHQWNLARTAGEKPLLIIDEVQKVSGWSEAVKSLWDEDRRQNHDVRVLLLGSSALLMQKGLSDSLTGRFFLHRLRHWQYGDMSRAFAVPLEGWLYFGGYPGAVSFLDNEGLWRSYVRDSLIETVIARDVLQMERIAKPALLRHLFMLSTAYPAQILSYNKMLGQLTDAGNTTTLAHYVQVLHSAFLLSGLELFKVGQRPKRGSSPKLILWNSALVNAVSGYGYEATRNDPERWGRLVENAVGAALLNQLEGTAYELYYWREKDWEVDFVLHAPGHTWAIEVKSSRMKNAHGLRRFLDRYPDAQPFIVGGTGMPLEEFFGTPLTEVFGA